MRFTSTDRGFLRHPVAIPVALVLAYVLFYLVVVRPLPEPSDDGRMGLDKHHQLSVTLLVEIGTTVISLSLAMVGGVALLLFTPKFGGGRGAGSSAVFAFVAIFAATGAVFLAYEQLTYVFDMVGDNYLDPKCDAVVHTLQRQRIAFFVAVAALGVFVVIRLQRMETKTRESSRSCSSA